MSGCHCLGMARPMRLRTDIYDEITEDTMKRIIAVALALLAGACASGSGSGGGKTEGIVDFSATLAPTVGYQVRGTANAVASLGRTGVTVEIDGATPGAHHPWHVHQGKCGSNGPVVGKAADYPVIDVDADG